MSDLRAVVNDHWAALQAASRGSGWLTSALPVQVGDESVLCAVGPDDRRHLLVPVPAGEDVRADTRSAAVHLLQLTLQAGDEARTYANLVLLRDDLADVFTALCADLIAVLAVNDRTAQVAVSQVLDAWRELFRGGPQLSTEELAGLFGELVFLNELLDLDASLLTAWRGPLRAAQDFIANDHAAEIKATASSEGRSIRIHGIDQLVAPSGGLLIRWMRLSTADTGGRSVPELVDMTAGRIDRPRELWQLLARAGYLTADRDRYAGLRFSAVETAHYEVTDGFPRIVPGSFADGVPGGLSQVRYTVDLDQAPPPMQQDEVRVFMSAMAKR
ncbi:PD-(D/E)XK motif protein [Symbioplanes lichenis]|uniref:PD-(D/E)XK motif protein n=1 Tax=Symbioplanes lichenis TaxID=1629072 RepID=UPI0027386F5C|nr:PD-(D/E)XK motif protein [Actinoplanes lichenis]